MVEFLVKIVRLVIVLHSILKVVPLTTISHGIQPADSTSETIKLEIPNLELAISIIVAKGPLIVGR